VTSYASDGLATVPVTESTGVVTANVLEVRRRRNDSTLFSISSINSQLPSSNEIHSSLTSNLSTPPEETNIGSTSTKSLSDSPSPTAKPGHGKESGMKAGVVAAVIFVVIAICVIVWFQCDIGEHHGRNQNERHSRWHGRLGRR
jgi:hypothetical protein